MVVESEYPSLSMIPTVNLISSSGMTLEVSDHYETFSLEFQQMIPKWHPNIAALMLEYKTFSDNSFEI